MGIERKRERGERERQTQREREGEREKKIVFHILNTWHWGFGMRVTCLRLSIRLDHNLAIGVARWPQRGSSNLIKHPATTLSLDLVVSLNKGTPT